MWEFKQQREGFFKLIHLHRCKPNAQMCADEQRRNSNFFREGTPSCHAFARKEGYRTNGCLAPKPQSVSLCASAQTRFSTLFKRWGYAFFWSNTTVGTSRYKKTETERNCRRPLKCTA